MVTDSELVYKGLTGKCNKWSRHKWVGSRGPLAHADLWEDLWGQWQLLGDSVGILWVPSHVGVTGNEHANAKASKGAKKAYECVMNQKSVQDIWGNWDCRRCQTLMTPTQTAPGDLTFQRSQMRTALRTGPSNLG